jgi:hypothetical protein
MKYVNSLQPLRKFALHPLIHTFLNFTLVQDIENCQEGGKRVALP